jgi:1-deoxy-D-xylulose-5-phosphate reductoisomerase
VKPLDFTKLSALTFEKPDLDRFPCLGIAIEALRLGGTMPTVMNAANEILVESYLKDKIGFYDISDTILSTMNRFSNIIKPTLDDIFEADLETRTYIKKLLG